MYFNNENNFYHGIMFHHFHDKKIHLKGQGSISKDDFYKIIKFIGKRNILDANIFFEKYSKNKLKENEVCFTFDDALKCQIDIALPVLEDMKIKSFFFVYTSIFDGVPDNLEVFRYFRLNFFNSTNDFYNHFYKSLNTNLDEFFSKNSKKIVFMRKNFPFYSDEDIKFRLVRDFFLSKDKYENIMLKMIKNKKFDYKKLYQKLYFDNNDLLKLDKLGHIIGLHSHTHPTLIESLTFEEQQREYIECVEKLSKLMKKTKKSFKFMSHPCGSYNKDTLKILKDLGVKLGFKQIMAVEKSKGMKFINNTNLEIARQDHAVIYNKMKHEINKRYN